MCESLAPAGMNRASPLQSPILDSVWLDFLTSAIHFQVPYLYSCFLIIDIIFAFIRDSCSATTGPRYNVLYTC